LENGSRSDERGDLITGEAPALQQGVGDDSDGQTLPPHQRPRLLAEAVEVTVAPVQAQRATGRRMTRSSASTGASPKRSTSASTPAKTVTA
jgi:hypothetical protein